MAALRHGVHALGNRGSPKLCGVHVPGRVTAVSCGLHGLVFRF